MRRRYRGALAATPAIAAVLLIVQTRSLPTGGSLRWPNWCVGYRPITAGTVHDYALHIEAGQYALVEVDQRDIDLALAVSGPGFHVPDLDGSEWGKEAVAIVARATGTYHIRVIASADTSAHGTYQIAVAQLRAAQPADERALHAQVAFTGAQQLADGDAAARRARERLFQEAIADWQAAGDLRHQAQALNRLGRLYHRHGRYMEAQHAFESALALWNQIGDEFGRVSTWKLIANLGGFFGEQRATVPVLQHYLDIWRRLGDRRGEAMLVSSISSYYGQRRRYAEAIRYETQALRLREALGDPHAIADSVDELAQYYGASGRTGEALSWAHRSLALQRQLGDRHGIAAALSLLAGVLGGAGRMDERIRYLRESLALRHAEGDRMAEVAMHRELSDTERRLGRLEPSFEDARQALALEADLAGAIQRPVWSWAFTGWSAVMNQYLSALLALHWKYPDRGYGLQAFLAADGARGHYIHDGGPTRLRDIQQLLDSDTVLLEYTAVEDGAIWIVTRHGFEVKPLREPEAIRQWAREAAWRMGAAGQVGSGAEAEYRKVTARLSRLLLAPAGAALKARRILIVSDESFAELPIAPLPDPTQPDGSPLFLHHEIVHLVSASAAVAARKRTRATGAHLLAIVADPVFDTRDSRVLHAAAAYGAPLEPDLLRATRSAGLTRDGAAIPRLPFGRLEARAIRALAPTGAATFVDFAASRERVVQVLNQYRVVHLATHGLLNSDQPELSGLIFSLVDRQGRPRPGFLRLHAIYGLKTSADLVTLAACETALGKQGNATGVVGLTGAFLHAGAARVLSTLWKVDDEATAALMAEFYRGIFAQHLSPPEALRRAQLSVANTQRWRSPYYWAGVILYGDWRTIWMAN